MERADHADNEQTNENTNSDRPSLAIGRWQESIDHIGRGKCSTDQKATGADFKLGSFPPNSSSKTKADKC